MITAVSSSTVSPVATGRPLDEEPSSQTAPARSADEPAHTTSGSRSASVNAPNRPFSGRAGIRSDDQSPRTDRSGRRVRHRAVVD